MERKDRVDAFGAVALIGFSALLGFNQVVIRVVNEGLQPVFFAALRSSLGIVCILAWFGLRRRPLGLSLSDLGPGLLIGLLFATEFILLFIALDLTTVTRASVVFYTMPLWLALMAHFALPGEKITGPRAAGLSLAFAGVVIAIAWRGSAGGASLLGDVLALLAAMCWAALALVARTGLEHLSPDRQLLWQVGASAPILLAATPFFGPLIRDLQPIHLLGLGFQVVVIVTFAFAFWFWLLKIYPAASVAAFSFLSPIFGVLFGWALLGEPAGAPVLVALLLVSIGLVLINRPQKE